MTTCAQRDVRWRDLRHARLVGLAHGDPASGARLLGAFWDDVQARTPWDAASNALLVGRYRLDGVIALPAVSPQLLPAWGTRRLRRLIERHLPAKRLPTLRRPLLQLGAVDVLSGAFKTFSSARGEISVEALLASAAVPTLFPAVELEGRVYWDGLFSQNPPVRDLPRAEPTELWVLQINPPRSTLLLERNLDLPSKVDRSPELIEALLAAGRRQARAFLAALVSSPGELAT